ncbi:MAG: uncharacterized protein K0R38_378 [Polyangiaceae bacterium]|nr:uncharacterized protein [Polyangiaceae bacterium]
MLRNATGLVVVLLLTACPPPKSAEPTAPTSAPVPSSDEPAPLPPEETPTPVPTEPPVLPAAKPVEPGIAPTGAPTRGKLPKGVVDEKLKEAQPGILSCYQRALKSKPELSGSVNVDFVVSTEGKVVHAASAEGDDALADEATVRCILTEIEQLVFPPPSGGRVFINYPIKLEPPKP